MAKLKNGDLLTCQVCGLVVVVDEACGCAVGEVICCEDNPMVKGKAAAAKAKKKALPTTAAKPAAVKKAVKGKAAAPAKKPAAKAKPAAKKAGKKPAIKAKAKK
ncbi:MAG: hypothetical protein ABFD82_07245 [Syntrophaceae bacterium]